MYTYKKTIVNIEHHLRSIYGVLYMPESEKRLPLVIFSHGFNGSHRDFVANSEFMASRGIASFSFDFCGGSVNSKSDLKTTNMTIFTEKEDLIAVIDHLKSMEFIDDQNIYLFGASQGGLVSALTAEEYQNQIKGLIMLFPAFCIADDWNKRFPQKENIPEVVELWGVSLGKVYFEAVHGYDVFRHIGSYDKKVLIFHGDKDEIVPLEYAKKASGLYQKVKLEIFQGEGHGFSEEGNRKVLEMTYDFIKSIMEK